MATFLANISNTKFAPTVNYCLSVQLTCRCVEHLSAYILRISRHIRSCYASTHLSEQHYTSFNTYERFALLFKTRSMSVAEHIQTPNFFQKWLKFEHI